MFNQYQQYRNQAVMTASGPELTLMLYDGAIRFCNQAEDAIQKKDAQNAHINIVKAQNIIEELLITLDKKYEIAKQMEPLYRFILEQLIAANMKKDVEALDNARKLIREFRDAWAQIMKQGTARVRYE